MGFAAEDLTTNKSLDMFTKWLNGNCQPNYRQVGVVCFHCFILLTVIYVHLFLNACAVILIVSFCPASGKR